jgi:hypothetical protein
MAKQFGRAAKYVIACLAFTGVILGIRFTVFNNVSSERRLPLALAYILLLAFFLGIAGTYERRQLIVRSGWRGRGTFGYLRGWIKTSAAELTADTPLVNPQSERDLIVFNRFAAWAFGSTIIVVPLLLF